MSPARDPFFPTTHWTLIARLKGSDQQEVRRALDDICRQYHYPLYCYIRRRGLSHHDAEDALQEFMAKLLRLETFEQAQPEHGKLRGLLCVALQRFLISHHQSSAKQQQQREISVHDDTLPLEQAEQRYLKERFTEADTPELIFDRQWARELMARVMAQLGDSYAARGKRAVFDALLPSLLSGDTLHGEPVAELAAQLGMTAGNLRIAKNRLLSRYRDLLEKEVAQTVPEAEVRAEIAHLMQAFARR